MFRKVFRKWPLSYIALATMESRIQALFESMILTRLLRHAIGHFAAYECLQAQDYCTFLAM